jgi:protein required for attachment to host cells
MTPETTWIVIADGAMARFFFRTRPGIPLQELTDLQITAEQARHIHGHAAAVHDGVNHGSAGRGEQHDGHDADEQHFLSHIAGRINLATRENAYSRLVICAPPRALGVLRGHMTEAARGRVVLEIAKDIVRDKLRDIDDRLRGHRI